MGEMEKTATRKFTSRTPRIDVKPSPVQENNSQEEMTSNEDVGQDSSQSDESEIDSDAIMEAIQNELSSEQSNEIEDNASNVQNEDPSSNLVTVDISDNSGEETDNKS